MRSPCGRPGRKAPWRCRRGSAQPGARGGRSRRLSAPGEDSTGPRSCSTSATTCSWPGPASRRPRPTRPRRSRGSAPPSGPGAAASDLPRWCTRRAGGSIFFQPRLAIDESAALVWTRATPDGATTVQTAFRPKGGSFGPAQDLVTGGFDPDVAVDERGNAIVGRDRREPAGGVGVQAPHRSVRGSCSRFRRATDSPRAWRPTRTAMRSRSGIPGAVSRPRFAAPGAASAPGQTLSDPGLTAFDPDVAFDEEDAVIAWAAGDESGSRIQTVTRTERGCLTAVQTLSEPGGEAFEPRVAAEDGAAIVWTRDLRVQGAFRAEHRKSFGSARTHVGSAARRIRAGRGDGRRQQRVHGVDHRRRTPIPQLTEPQIQFSFRPAEDAYTEPAPVSTPGQLAFEPRIATDEREQRPRRLGRGRRRRHRPGASRIPAGRVRRSSFPQSWTAVARRLPTPPSRRSCSTSAATRWWCGCAPTRRVTGTHGSSRHSAPGVAASERRGWSRAQRTAWPSSACASRSTRARPPCGASSRESSLRAIAAFRPKGGGFGSPVTLSTAGKDGFEPDVGVDERGNSVVTWTEGDLVAGGPPAVMWAFKPRTKGFGGAAQLSPAGLPASGRARRHRRPRQRGRGLGRRRHRVRRPGCVSQEGQGVRGRADHLGRRVPTSPRSSSTSAATRLRSGPGSSATRVR